MKKPIAHNAATDFLRAEALSLLHRLEQLQPFSLTMPMVPAAAVSDEAMKGITDNIVSGQGELRQRIHKFLQGLTNTEGGKYANAEQQQLRFSMLKLRYNALLDQLDIFADVLAQRAEHNNGVWMAGLDVLASDALLVVKPFIKPDDLPPLMCFLERGHGAAIRRARTRLPGGSLNPVAVIQVPRERMVGSGIGSSLIHEVGHQGAALLDLVTSLRSTIRLREQNDKPRAAAWKMFGLWISEITSDFWSMGHLGVSATTGLMNVVSLPKYFVFRVQLDDPHPFPWIRVRLSIEMGKRLFPDEQWLKIEQLWRQLYPIEGLPAEIRQIIALLEKTIPDFITLLTEHAPKELKGQKFKDIFSTEKRQPRILRALFLAWKKQPYRVAYAPPSLVFAVIGQARFDKLLTPSVEAKYLSVWLTRWAQARAEDRLNPRALLPLDGAVRLKKAA
jgi:hypothetical protein